MAQAMTPEQAELADLLYKYDLASKLAPTDPEAAIAAGHFIYSIRLRIARAFMTQRLQDWRPRGKPH